ncbi:MAG TPA: orotidine-5'-phosphate decarboxylase [Myxococcaceae bacterium]|jgi:orotidine-5'-phosphate decarboxylase
MAALDRLAVAVDVPLQPGLELYRKVSAHAGVAKVGLSLFVEHGPRAVEAFRALGARVFLDLKLHDIPNTVELAAARAASLGVGLLTVHAQGGSAMLRAALAGAADGAAKAGVAPPRVLAVTVLTSLSDADVQALGYPAAASDVALGLSDVAVGAGVGGLVCSPREAARLRRRHGPSLFLCTPGIRPASSEAQDQARAETPRFAVEAGADLLVVGRPITAAADPAAAAFAIAREIAAAAPGA